MPSACVQIRLLACLATFAGLSVPAQSFARGGGVDTHGPDAAPATPALGTAARARTNPLVPRQWCGRQRSDDDRQNAWNNGDYQYHVIYALPADGPDRLAAEATGIQRRVFGASYLLERHYGRAIRLDLGTSCGPQYVDVTTVRLPQTTAELQAARTVPNGTLNAVLTGLPKVGFPTIGALEEGFAEPPPTDDPEARTRNFVVFLDGPAPRGGCGQATLFDDERRTDENLNNLGGKVALIYRRGSEFCDENIVRHEIGHTLGAVTAGAPNNGDGSHCNDAYEDTMCTDDAPSVLPGAKFESAYFDFRNDDYWDPPAGRPLPWWTVNLSRFVCPDAACNLPGVDASALPRPEPVPRPRVRRSSRRRPAVAVDSTRAGRFWSVSVRVRGSGTARVAVRCQPTRRSRTRAVYERKAKLPTSLRAKVRCWSLPSATVRRLKRR